MDSENGYLLALCTDNIIMRWNRDTISENSWDGDIRGSLKKPSIDEWAVVKISFGLVDKSSSFSSTSVLSFCAGWHSQYQGQRTCYSCCLPDLTDSRKPQCQNVTMQAVLRALAACLSRTAQERGAELEQRIRSENRIWVSLGARWCNSHRKDYPRWRYIALLLNNNLFSFFLPRERLCNAKCFPLGGNSAWQD